MAARPPAGLFFVRGEYPLPSLSHNQLPEPLQKRTLTFFDGQNLFHSARECFGYTFPNYDVMALSRAVCAASGLLLSGVRFYTGVPAAHDDALWNSFWNKKLLSMTRQGVRTFRRELRYRERTHETPGGATFTFVQGEEKGIDVRIALDVIRSAHRGEYDVAVIFSQDQDLSEVAAEIRTIAQEQRRWIKIMSAYPVADGANQRGINGTDWIRMDRAFYDACIDPFDYFPARRSLF
jgi:uncharacterized LabA/DUF88 family protein